MPLFTPAKDHSPGGLRFDSAGAGFQFAPITLAISQTNATVQNGIPLPCNIKIYGLAVNATTALAAAVVTGMNVVAGTAAEGATAAANSVAINGTKLFALDSGQAPVLTTAWATTFYPVPATLCDVIWPQSLPLTLRLVTSGSAAGVIQVSLLVKPYDINQTKPLYNAAGTALQI